MTVIDDGYGYGGDDNDGDVDHMMCVDLYLANEEGT